VTIFSDDFESTFPGSWSVSSAFGAAPTTWGKTTYRQAGGSASAWCAAGGSAPQPAGGNYVADMRAWMVYGPFSLADAINARMEFDLWYVTESVNDAILWGLSLDDNQYYGFNVSGSSSSWGHQIFNFADVTGINVIGQSQVWVAFAFASNATVEYEGAYVDNVQIIKTVNLVAQTLTVTKAGTGGGTVTSSPGGINCGSTCSANFDYNTGVTLSVSPGSSSTFTGWSGEGCSGTGTCQVTMSQARAVTATFEFVPSAATLFPITPCRVLDTRNANGPLGGPILAAGSRRVFTVAGTCGVPTGAKAIVSNLTVVGAGAQGELKVIGGHLYATTTSSISFGPSRARANNAVVQLAADDSGTISVINNSARTVHFILDVSGYFQ
jgi:hypothetical protein